MKPEAKKNTLSPLDSILAFISAAVPVFVFEANLFSLRERVLILLIAVAIEAYALRNVPEILYPHSILTLQRSWPRARKRGVYAMTVHAFIFFLLALYVFTNDTLASDMDAVLFFVFLYIFIALFIAFFFFIEAYPYTLRTDGLQGSIGKRGVISYSNIEDIEVVEKNDHTLALHVKTPLVHYGSTFTLSGLVDRDLAKKRIEQMKKISETTGFPE